MSTAIEIAYLFATAMFIFSLHWMNDPKTAHAASLPARWRCSWRSSRPVRRRT